MSEILKRAKERRQIALSILTELALIKKWQPYGRPVVVGAVAYDLVVSCDIDMEIYCPELKIEHGFKVLEACAQHPCVEKTKFANCLNKRDKALYWQIQYRHTSSQLWKIDMWSAPEDYDLPRSEEFIEPMNKTLTLAVRETILKLKEHRQNDKTVECLSIDLYRAVLEGNVASVRELREWLASNKTGKLTNWKPK